MTLPLYSVPETPDPNIQQKLATIPDHDVWVSASAGSGKTKVLTDRVLRLLLPDPDGRWQGAAPHKILCITFTKAGAALMALRVQAKLGEWAVMNDDDLIKSLSDLLGIPPSPEMLLAARKLFSTVLDTQNGLSIMTIHAFCQSTLGRFAIEAGVTPGFSVMEEPRANDILRKIIDKLIIECELNKHPDIAPSFKHIATYLDLDKLRDTLLSMMGKSREISEFLKTASSRDKIRARLLAHLGQDENLSADMCFEKLMGDLSESDLKKIAQILGTGSPTYQENGRKLADWIALSYPDRQKNMDLFADALLTDKGVRSVGTKIPQTYPEILDLIHMSLSHYYLYKDRLACVVQAEQTADLLIIVQKCLHDYGARKKELNVLDFNDLILKTRTLLESQSLDWVHYKLDEGIDHILVDEAQDTNIHQWEIIRHLSDEFLSGTGNNQRLRSLFVVGDEKQSIFSFHGAAPEAFKTMRDFFEDRSLNALRQFKRIPLETSFRSVRPILQLVDNVFENPHLSTRLGLQSPQKLVHFPHRDKAGGLVELWDFELIPKPDTKSDIKWVLPPISTHSEAQENEISTSSALASKIATTINGWLENGEILASSGLKIEPRDILILVRTRTSFVPDLVRQLKIRGIPVSGIDRMKLTDQIAVMDCLALAKFARFPEDDLSLACLLKSPFIRMDEDGLMELALNRQSTLWGAVQERCDARIVSWLQQVIDKSRTEKPFDFFDDILNGICPYHHTMTGWRAFATCLGADCLDPLDEFLSYCLTTEVDGVFSLEELVKILESNPIEIKRDTEDGEKDSINQVRIMTVHASKGLEAPIVFLPDTIGVPSKGKIDALQWMAGKLPLPLWAARSKDGCKVYQDLKDASFDKGLSEYLRLLYVALTRARDRLYIMGEGKTLQYNEFCWYKLIYDAFEKLPYTKIEKIKRYGAGQSEPIQNKTMYPLTRGILLPLPSWVLNQVTDDKVDRKITVQPSRLGAETRETSRSPIDPESINRFKRGNLTHKLFQILPEIPIENRQVAADAFLSRLGQDLSPDIRHDIVQEVLNIFNDPVFADVFGENSMAEVPISGDLGDGKMISGQIDRLIIGHNKILIVDFKTNRPSPRNENDIPEAYKNQLKAYKTALSRMFPDKEISCALLWTDQPLLMTVRI
jgi:ATP-dependent helicase/nuclease subunit A